VARTTLGPPLRPSDGFGVRGKLAHVRAPSTAFVDLQEFALGARRPARRRAERRCDRGGALELVVPRPEPCLGEGAIRCVVFPRGRLTSRVRSALARCAAGRDEPGAGDPFAGCEWPDGHVQCKFEASVAR
jgi:hypothetical protein